MNLRCAHCRKPHGRCVGAINRAAKYRLPLYCDRKCAGLARRTGKTKAQKVAEKRLYDMAYRKKNRSLLKAKKRAWFKRSYDPARAAAERKKNMARHVAYCRRPEYRAWKKKYDKRFRKSNLKRRYHLPPWAPESLAESIHLFKTLRKEQKREHQRS